MPGRGRGRGRGRGAGASASAGAHAVPSVPEELIGSIMAQLASAALTTDEHELRASSDPVHARLIQLVTCTRVCKAWQRQAATCLADQRFWEQLCTNRWHDAVPPTPDYRAHYVKRRALEKHKATPDWRDQFHLLLDVRWNNLEQPHWPGQNPDDSKFLVRSLSLRDAIIETCNGIPCNATWHIPGVHIEPGLKALTQECPTEALRFGSCVLHERGERMLEVVTETTSTHPYWALSGFNGYSCLQISHAKQLAALPTIELGMHSWSPRCAEEEGPDCEGIDLQSCVAIEIVSAECKDDPDYDETDHDFCTEVTLYFTAGVLTGEPLAEAEYGPNFLEVDEWPELFRFLPWV